MEIINRERTRRILWSVERTDKEILFVLSDERGRTVAALTPDGARKVAGALNAAALDLTRELVLRRGEIVGKIQ